MPLQNRRRHVGRDRAFKSRGDNARFVAAVRRQYNPAALHDILDSESKTAQHNTIRSLRLATNSCFQRFVHTGKPAGALERRAGLIEAEMSVLTDSQNLQID